jgi:hypothetical protein
LVGVNFVGPGSPQPVYALQSSLRERGVELGVVRVTNEHAAVAGLDCETAIFRVKGAGRAEPNPLDFDGRREWSGAEWFARWWAALSVARREPGRKLAYTFLNEVFDVAHIPFWLRFYSELMDAATRHGVTITVGNFAAATFDARHIAALVPLARECARRGHIMSGNVYWYDEDSDARFRYLRALMDAVPEARWVIEELGWARNDASYQGYVALRVLLNKCREVYPEVDAALWAFSGSGGGWPHSQIPVEDAIAAIAAG